MKKIIIIFCIVCTIIATTVIILTTHPATQEKFSNTHIVFSLATQEFRSNLKASTNNFDKYTFSITNNKNVAFENPVLTSTHNVIKNVEATETGINVHFHILSGNSFSFTLQSDNFESITKTYSAVEYVQASSIVLKVATTPNGNFENFSNQNNKIFIVPSQFEAQANLDGFPTAIFVKAESLTHPNCNFDLQVAASGHLQLSGNKTACLTAKSQGTSRLTIIADDGSGATINKDFSCEYVQPTSVQNLPNKIEIDMANLTEYILTGFEVLPAYAQNFELDFTSSDESVFEVIGNRVVAKKAGNGILICKLNNHTAAEIPVIITYTALPHFVFALNNQTKSAYGSAVTLEDNILSLNIKDLSGYASLTIDVYINNFGGTLKNITWNISDPNSILLEEAGDPNFGFGSQTSLPFTIFVELKTGEFAITFSKTIDQKLISEILIINIINN